MPEIKRPNYYTSQFLVEEDFQDEQAYHRNMRYRHNQLLHTWGVVNGLMVSQPDGTQLTVSSGMAIDKNGKEIILSSDSLLSLTNATAAGDVYVTIEYQEVVDEQDKDTTSGVENKYRRTLERPLLKSTTSLPPNDGTVLLLARVRPATTGGNPGSIDNSVRTLASSKINIGSITTDQLANNSVTTVKIQNEAVTNAKIAPLAITQDKIANDSITTVKIINEAVTGAKIAPLAITDTKLANDSVTTIKIQNEAVTGAKIAPLAITDAKLASDSVTTIKILNEAVTSTKIAPLAITESKLANAAVTTAKLADNSVNADKIFSGSVNNLKLANGAVSVQKLKNKLVLDITFTASANFTTTHQFTDYEESAFFLVSLSPTTNGGVLSWSWLMSCTRTIVEGSSSLLSAQSSDTSVKSTITSTNEETPPIIISPPPPSGEEIISYNRQILVQNRSNFSVSYKLKVYQIYEF
jgi:hypothetical protein